VLNTGSKIRPYPSPARVTILLIAAVHFVATTLMVRYLLAIRRSGHDQQDGPGPFPATGGHGTTSCMLLVRGNDFYV
jgi:hypothetical protein